jgi:hypothetical protein
MRCSVVAIPLKDSVSISWSQSLMGFSLHDSGDMGSARRALDVALVQEPASCRTMTAFLGQDSRNLAGAVLASTLWLQGYPTQAVDRARRTVEEASGMDHPLTLAIALAWAVFVFLRTGDLKG